MTPRCSPNSGLFLPFLYPPLFYCTKQARIPRAIYKRWNTTALETNSTTTATEISSSSDSIPRSRLNPTPDDYAISTFADKARIAVHAGGGGHGCISFLREAFMDNGPANGGDGGHGGNVYIQAVHSETSLHKLARRRIVRAARGKTGQGSSRGGARGEDVIIQVPVGTVVREIERVDPAIEEQAHYQQAREKEREYQRLVREAEAAQPPAETSEGDNDDHNNNIDRESRRPRPAPDLPNLPEAPEHPNLHKFILYPGISTSERRSLTLPRLPRRERIYAQPSAPIRLDLSTATPQPILLAAGGIGGLGNPHFVSKDRPRPLFATKGEPAVSVRLELELKLLADVGLVGLPNAGKSTLLRALTRSRARVGNWAFTTLQPNIGTVVLDNHKGRPVNSPPFPSTSSRSDASRTQRQNQHAIINDARYGSVVVSSQSPDFAQQLAASTATQPEPRTRFTIADIPGLIEGAHLDRGLGVAFLRHVERAGVLAFVVDLSAGNAVAALKALWNEVGLYARMREEEERERELSQRIDWEGDGRDSGSNPSSSSSSTASLRRQMTMVTDDHTFPSPPQEDEGGGGLHIAHKPWFVVATKGDLPDTQENFAELRRYLGDITRGHEPHPSHVKDAWVDDVAAIPVSAIRGHGVDRIVHWTLGLLDD